VLLLTTRGRRTGKRHTTPLLFHHRADGSLLLIAVNAAADWDPDWLLNLVAHPDAEIEIEQVRHSIEAAVLDDEERIIVWDEARRAFPGLEATQSESSRTIPLVRLTIR
jgi:deazaflavin-dependent oxidoreductase (nitroreductase family)